MLIIGLTGSSGAGKSIIASLFARHGVPSIDTDAVYHDLILPPSACLDELVARFGSAILTAGGTLDRAVLAARVFAAGHEAERHDLNRITHRHVLAEVRRRLIAYEARGYAAVLVDAPQLFESGFDAECDRILSVLAPRALRLSRIMERDGLDEARAAARLDAQHDDDFFRAHSDAVVVNDGSPDAPECEVLRLLDEWGVPYVV